MSKIIKENIHKLDPKIRMVVNGDGVVNTVRAEEDPSVAVVGQSILNDTAQQRQPGDLSTKRSEIEAERGSLDKEETPRTIYANVFVKLREDVEEVPKVLSKSYRQIPPPVRKKQLVTAAIPLNRMDDVRDNPNVASIERTEQIRFTLPVNISQTNTEPVTHAEAFAGVDVQGGSHPVLVGIIDVQGFDFAHKDFLAGDQTRFYKIWDQGGDSRQPPEPFNYGSEISQKDMNLAIENADAFGLPATDLEPQSQMTLSSHGTHVASIAAGNHGVCPNAYIAGVLISLPNEDQDRRKSFYDSTRIAHAVDYLFSVGEELSKELEKPVPVSINISLGTNGHAHDASSATSRWIDDELATPGRSICVAAGNAGQEEPIEPGDWGFVMGRIHTSGVIKTKGDQVDFEWVVLGDGIADISENELEIWYSSRDRFDVEVKPPGLDWLPIVKPGEFIENEEIDGGTFVSIYNELYASANGENYIACYLSPFFSDNGVAGVRSGTWKVRLHGRDVRDGHYHGWIERDDPRRLGRIGVQEAWRFPSMFSSTCFVDDTTVSSLACGQRIISVANLDDAGSCVNPTSSQGPTRDGREKPDIAAPGTDIIAANGFDPKHPWVSMSGTSMASPYVAGVIALMLSINPGLTAAQIGGILRRTSTRVKNSDFKWQNDEGFGKISVPDCLAEVRFLLQREDNTRA